MEGRVDAGQFNALIAGRDPRQHDRLLRSATSDPRIAAFDLTFSAPKSVSVLFAIADDETSGELVAAHEAAVRAALEYVEQAALWVRRGKGGRVFHRGGGLVAAAYRHRMSRALDPQLHTHVVCANLAEGPDGRWTALHHPSLYVHAQTAGYLYEAHLRAEVRERLGLEWEPVVKGIADLVDMPEEVRREFSRRRGEMFAAVAADQQRAARGEIPAGHVVLSMSTKSLAAATAIATRDRKQYGIDTGSWREEVRARAAEHGLDRQAVEQLVAAGRDRLAAGLPDVAVDERALGDLLAGPAGLTEKQNRFTDRDVLRAFAAAAVQGARTDRVQGQADRFNGRADLLDTIGRDRTTAELVACERRLIAAAVGRVGEASGVLDRRAVDAALASASRPPTGEQAAAVRAVTGSGNGVEVIEARAGTGKTFIAGILRQAYQRAGQRVVGVAPTGRAARELSEEAGLHARTVDRLLLDLAQAGGRLAADTVVIYDEAGMGATRLSEQLLAAAQASQAKVICIGDPGQLASVRAGGWMRAVSDRVGKHRLLEVQRQRDRTERRALGALHDRRPRLYLEWARRKQRIEVHLRDGGLAAALADWTAAMSAHGPWEAVLIARDNDTRNRLNQLARAHLHELGQLGDDVDYGPVTIAVGDRVIARRNDSLVDVDNGTRGTVRATYPHAVVIETDAGTIRELPAGYVSEHLEHAYCLTGHGMQGGTVEHATVLASPRDLTSGWSYTALSRARGHTRLHIDATEITARAAAERDELAPQDRIPLPDREDVLEQVAARMHVRDDEDLAVDQLPTPAAGAGRADDPDLHDARQLGPQPQEHGAERSQSPPPAGVVVRLRAIAAELAQLGAQLQSLPLGELRRLEQAQQQAAHAAQQRAAALHRLRALPAPRRRLGRLDDPHAIERAQLTAVIDAATTQQAALERHQAQLRAQLGPVDQIRAERDGLQARADHLQQAGDTLLDRAAQAELAREPEWATRTLGPRPSDRRRAGWWDRTALAIARYRIEHEIPDHTDGIGTRPDDDETRSRWRRVELQLARARQELAHHDLGRDR